MRVHPRVRRTAIALATGLICVSGGCGGDDGVEGASEDSVRDCLTEAGLAVEASDLGASASLGSASPDFRVLSDDGEIADVIVERDEEKASKTAADIEGAKQSFGAAQAVVVKEQNAVVVFEDEPAGEFREQVEGCAG